MKALKALDKAIPKLIKSLTKQFGVKTTIYLPLSLDSMYGGKGSNITYSEEEAYSELMLIPSIVKEKISGVQGLIDPFIEGDPAILYLPGSVFLPDYSKVVVELFKGGAYSVFKIENCVAIQDDEYVYLRKYTLTPMTDIQQMDIPDMELEDLVDHELDIEDSIDVPVVRETVSTAVNKVQWTYSPITSED